MVDSFFNCLIIPRVETLKPQVKTREWDKQPILIPPQLLVGIRKYEHLFHTSVRPLWGRGCSHRIKLQPMFDPDGVRIQSTLLRTQDESVGATTPLWFFSSLLALNLSKAHYLPINQRSNCF